MNFNSKRSFFYQLATRAESLKSVPWFTLLLLFLLGYGAFQVCMFPQVPAHAVIRKSIFKTGRNMQAFFSVKGREENAPEQAIKVPHKLALFAPAQRTDMDLGQYDKRLLILEKRDKAVQSELEALKKESSEIKMQLDQLQQEVVTSQPASVTSTPFVPQHGIDAASLSAENTFVDYSVHAVIEGRAWLNSKSGKMITVSLGNELPPLGTVQAIDTENRLVYFDEGAIIGPSADDA